MSSETQIIVGKDATGKNVKVRVTDDGYLVAKGMAYDSVSGNNIQVACDPEGRLFGAYEGDLTVSMGDVEKLLGGNYWKRSKPYLYGSNRTKYACKNTDVDAAETDTDWYIWKFTDADKPEKEGPRIGRVDSEANINNDHTWKI